MPNAPVLTQRSQRSAQRNAEKEKRVFSLHCIGCRRKCSRKTGRLIVSQAAGIFSCWAHRNEPNEKRKGGFEQEATERTEIQQRESLFPSFSSVQDFGCGFAALCLGGSRYVLKLFAAGEDFEAQITAAYLCSVPRSFRELFSNDFRVNWEAVT